MSRDALLDQLLQESLPVEVRRACLADLSRQLGRIADAAEQQTFRMVLLRAAHIATSKGNTAVADELNALATRDARWLVTLGALEACHSLGTPIRVTVQDGPPVDRAIEAQLEKLSFPVGPELETKYRFSALTCESDVLAVTLAPTTWASARKFHTTVQQDPAWASKLADGSWLTPMPFGDWLLPGIAVVHAIIMTSDDKVIVAQRSAEVGYAPEHWSVSFEEQLNGSDIDHEEDAFTAAARRGFAEEFGAELPARDVTPLTTVMQIDLLNLGMITLLRPSMTAEDIRSSWRSVAKDSWEAKEVRGLQLGDLDAGLANLGLLHPSSELRRLALRRWLATR
jgi:NUDIX domain